MINMSTQSDCLSSGPNAAAFRYSNYDQLKKDFSSKWVLNGNSVMLKAAIDNFSNSINSKREETRIETMEQLLQILEHRDQLSETNVKALERILNAATIFPNRGEKWTFDLKKSVKEYREVPSACNAGCADSHKESIWDGHKWVYGISFRVLSPPNRKRSVSAVEEHYDITKDLDCVLGSIGVDWLKFVRALPGMTEGELNNVRASFKNEGECLRQCLLHWQKIASEDLLTRESIIFSLSHCCRQDIVNKLSSLQKKW